MKNIILIAAFSLFILMFCLTEFTLRYFLPLAVTDWNVWLTYFNIKDAAYDVMFFIASYLIYSISTKLLKALAAFALILTGGSVVDKVIFGINGYLWSDILLVSLGIGAAVYVYKKEYGGQ